MKTIDSRMIEHRGILQSVESGKSIVAMETAGCGTCSQSSGCGIGRLASGRPATLLTLPAGAGIKAGDQVCIALPESRVTLSALFGYLFPAVAMMLGAGLGVTLEGTDGATALGAMVGFLGALATVRIVVGLLPGLMPAPQIIPMASHAEPSPLSQQEFHHEH